MRTRKHERKRHERLQTHVKSHEQIQVELQKRVIPCFHFDPSRIKHISLKADTMAGTTI
jgi:hypothetical protein